MGDVDWGKRFGVDADALPSDPFIYGPVVDDPDGGEDGLIHLIREGAGVSTKEQRVMIVCETRARDSLVGSIKSSRWNRSSC